MEYWPGLLHLLLLVRDAAQNCDSQWKGSIHFSEQKLTNAKTLLIAAEAGALNVIITNPIWVVNTRLNTTSKPPDQFKSHSYSLP